MKKLGYALCLSLAGLVLSSAAVLATDADTLRPALEQALKNYGEACRTGDAARLKAATSTFFYGTIANNLASAGRTVTPEVIKSLAGMEPDLTRMKFYGVFQNGPTAALVFSSDSAGVLAEGKSGVDFTVVKLVKEGGDWKMDQSGSLSRLKYEKDGTEAKFGMADMTARSGLKLDGVVHPAPAPLPVAEVIGYIRVSDSSFKAEVTVNGVRQEGASSTSPFGSLLTGGLKKGANTVEIVVTAANPAAKSTRLPEVMILVPQKDQQLKDVFSFKPAPGEAEGKHTLTFTVEVP